MRRPSLSKKLLLAALPLLLAVGGLLAITVISDLDRIDQADQDANLATIANRLVDTVEAVHAEQAVAIRAMLGEVDINAADVGDTPEGAPDPYDQAAATSDAALAALADSFRLHPQLADVETRQVGPALSVARRLSRQWTVDPTIAGMAGNTPFANYSIASSELSLLGQSLLSATANTDSGQLLVGASKFGNAAHQGATYALAVAEWSLDADQLQLVQARSGLNGMRVAFEEFEATTTPEWAADYRQLGLNVRTSGPRRNVDDALRGETNAIPVLADIDEVTVAIDGSFAMQRSLLEELTTVAEADAADTTSSVRIRLGVIAGALLLALIVTALVARSITRRVKAVADGANRVATEQLPALVEAMRDPRGRSLPDVSPVSTKGGDELAALAESFNTLQHTLTDVAEEQVAVLRRGVSDIFVTMARRNRSLVDRQLALLDRYEQDVDDPTVLESYYQLDHLATRMRRNSESLLVLANAEPRRGRVAPTSITDVVRAATGEIEDYRRITVESMDPVLVRGALVADVSHLVAELLDNATAFSPPETSVRVGGRLLDAGYLIRIDDAGVGIGADRLAELNELLANPPIVGLSVEPTLGVSVVSLLAAKHQIKVVLKSSEPGLIVDVLLPTTVFAEAPAPEPAPPVAAPVVPAGSGLRIDPDAPAPVAAEPEPVHLHTPPAAGTGLRIDDPADPVPEPTIAPEPAVATTEPEPAATPEPAFSFRIPDPTDTGVANLPTTPAEPRHPANPTEPAVANLPTTPTEPRHPAHPTEPAVANLPSNPAEPRQPVISPLLGAAFERAGLDEGQLAPPVLPTLGDDQPAPLERRNGEFNRPVAPPLATGGISAAPVAPLDARPAPGRTLDPDIPALPTRQRTAVDGGPDRLADDGDDAAAGVAAALAAFDQEPVTTAAGLPARTGRTSPGAGFGGFDEDRPVSTGASALDPDELRARLRAFQTEHRNGHDHHRPSGEDPR